MAKTIASGYAVLLYSLVKCECSLYQNHPIDAEVTIDSDTDTSSSDEDVQVLEETNLCHQLTYTIKLINPACKKEFQSVELGKAKVCKSLGSLQSFISKKLSNNPKLKLLDLRSVEMGYVEPGHGMKGRKMWINTDEDVKMMYVKHVKKKSLLLWCYTDEKKEESAKASGSGKGASRYVQHVQDRSEVDKIYEQLQEKHDSSYSPRKLRAWANMVQMKSWKSLDKPPNKPFFKLDGRKRSSTEEVSPAHKKLSVSPGKKARVRSELIEQLDKFHKLKESGAVSSTEYEELRSTILSDIKTL